MFIFLSKLLPMLVYPLGLACLLLALALIFRRQKWTHLLAALALAVLWLGSTRWTAVLLARSLEWRYLPAANVPPAEAIVVLGGGTASHQPPRPTAEVEGAGDRVIYAAYLYRQGKAPYILVSGGSIDFLEIRQQSPAKDMAELLQFMDVPAGALWLQPASRNTYEDALFSSQLLEEKGLHRILLVTSALHMPRSVALFEHTGLEVIPAPTDFNVTEADVQNLWRPDLQSQLINLLPSTDNLGLTTRVLKEYIGMLIYRLRGWM